MAGRRRVGRTVHIPATAIGSGARVTDLFPVPLPIFLLARFIRFIWRHWYIALCIYGLFFLDLWQALLIFLSLPVLIFVYVWLSNTSAHPSEVVRASYHLTRSKIKWKTACEAAQLNEGARRPRLIQLYPWRPVKIVRGGRGNSLEFTIDLGRVGQTTKHLEENREYLAAVLKARRTRIVRITPGTARLTIEWEKNARRGVVANPANEINATQLPRVELDQNVLLELDTSLLVVGESGSGKSNLTWYTLDQLNKNEIHYRLYVIDPKKVELADLVDSPYTVKYSDSQRTADEVIDVFYNDMMSTFERMKATGSRKILLGERNPLSILIIDEVLLCKQATQGVDSQLGEILSAGRAAGFICIANSQLGQVDAIGRLRDLFPQRVCMAVKSQDLTNAVLGPNAEARGARCTEITEKGVGYIYTDYAGSFERFKPPFISNTKEVAKGWNDPFVDLNK